MTNEIQHRAILEAIPDLILRVNRDGLCLDCKFPKNSKAKAFVKIEKHLSEVLPPQLLNRQLHYIEQALTTGELQVYEHQLVKYDKIAHEEVRISAITKNEVLIMVRDITARKKAQEQLRYRLVVETSLAMVSRELANYEQADLNRVLRLMGVAVDASRAYLMRFRANWTKVYMSHEWCDSQTQSDIENFQDIDASLFPWWMNKLKSGQNILISDLEGLPEEAQAEKNYLKSVGVNSVLAVPIYNHFGQLWGQIGFDTSGSKTKNWSDGDVQMLQIVGEMIYAAHSRALAQQKLRASEALYAGIFNHSAEAVFLVDVLPDGRFVYETMNQTYEEATGISFTEFVGKTPAEVFSPKMAAQIENFYRVCVAIKETLYYEETLELPIGKRIWRTNLVPIFDPQGRIVKLQGSSRDITEEKKAIDEQIRLTQYQRLLASLTLKIRQSWQIEEVLQTAVTEIKKTLQAERVLFFRLLPDGFGKVVNEAVDSAFPVMLDEVIVDHYCWQKYQEKYGNSYIEVCPDVLTAGLDSFYQELLTKYQIRSHIVLPILVKAEVSDNPPQISKKNSPYLPQESENATENGSKLSFSGFSEVRGLLCVQMCSQPRTWTKDEIDLVRQLADQLGIAIYQNELREQEISQRQELARSNLELEHFAYIASHDLQQPLQIISDYAQLLKRRYHKQLDEKANKFIHHIIEGTRRMQKQITDLLEYSQVGTRKKSLQVTDCNWVLEESINNLQVVIRQQQAVVMSSEKLPILLADSNQLVQLFQNLINNAIKYHSNAPPVVEISANHEEEGWLFSIKDNGIGIDPKQSERIFQIFQRLHTQDEYPGTGIGLAICQRIVERHGGRIWVNSELGQGATFHFIIPDRNYK